MSLRIIPSPGSEAWNAFVSKQPGGSLYQSYEWGQIRQEQGWKPFYIAVADGTVWKAAALVLVKRLPGGAGVLMHSPRGPLLAPADNALALTALSSAVRDLANRVGGM